jgi:hypothetical protein
MIEEEDLYASLLASSMTASTGVLAYFALAENLRFTIFQQVFSTVASNPIAQENEPINTSHTPPRITFRCFKESSSYLNLVGFLFLSEWNVVPKKETSSSVSRKN